MTTPIISLRNIGKRFGKTVAVQDVTLDIREGEFFALLGPSGCGKTTLLRMLAGFEVPTEGRILIDGQDLTEAAPNRRPVNMVFQSYAVFPHMSVFDNVAYGLKVEKTPAAERHRRVEEALRQVQLNTLAKRKPDQLSGGQRQRVALARALIKRPRVLLLDEPLSALDAKLRDQMRAELSSLQDKLGITFVMVTHDQAEALALADRCAVMRGGKLEQVAKPADLYDWPNSRFVADFIGSVNLFEGRLTVDRPDCALVHANDLTAPIYVDHAVAGASGATVWAALRPERIELLKRSEFPIAPVMADAPAGCNIAEGVVSRVNYLGGESLLDVALPGGRLVKVSRSNLTRAHREAFSVGEPVWLNWRAGASTVLTS